MPSDTDWIIGDSEDEGQEVSIPRPPNGDENSSISQYTVNKNNTPFVKPSEISSFTASTTRITTIVPSNDSISDASTKPKKPPKPKARPRQAFRVGTPESDIASVLTSNTEIANDCRFSSTGTTEIAVSSIRSENRTKDASSTSVDNVWPEPTEIIDLASDNEDTGLSYGVKQPAIPPSSQKNEDISTFFASTSGSSVVQISPPRARQSTTLKPAMAAPAKPASKATSGIDKGKRKIDKERTPPSSPVKARKKKRKSAGNDDDFDPEDVRMGESEIEPPKMVHLSKTRDKEEGLITEKKTKAKKSKVADKADKPKEKQARKKKDPNLSSDKTGNAPGSNNALKELTFKSKEFISDSENEDDLALKSGEPNPDPSLSGPPRPATASVLPSVSTTIKASGDLTFGPSIDESVLPSRSVGHLTSQSIPDVHLESDLTDLDDVPQSTKAKTTKGKKKADEDEKEKKGKKKKKGETVEAVKDGSKETVEQEKISVKPKNLKKNRKIIGSDEEDLEGEAEHSGRQATMGSNTHLTEPKKSPEGKVADVLESPDVPSEDVEDTEEIAAFNRVKHQLGDKENLKQNEMNHKVSKVLSPTSTVKDKFAIKHSIPRRGSISDLLKRVNSRPDSPFASPSSSSAYLMKSTRTALQRIAPLHPNRRTPPPPPPRPPPPKKTKKQLEMEERLEEELADTVDGWACMTSADRAALLKARIEKELGYDD